MKRVTRRTAAVFLFATTAAAGCGGSERTVTVTAPHAPVAAPSGSDLAMASSAKPSSASSAAAAPPSMSPFQATAMQSDKAEKIARSLAQEVGPRLAGSAGDKLAVAWAVKTMTSLGFTNVHTEAVTVPVWKRGAESAEIVSPTHQSLAIVALGWSGATPKAGVTGEVVEVGSLDALTKLSKEALKGKIVFANVVMNRTNDGTGYGAAVPLRFAGPKIAMDAGALAFVMRTVGTSEDREPHAGATALRETPKPIACGALATADADLLHATLAKNPDLKLRVVLTPEHLKDAQSANVVGEIPGISKKDEVILLGAHLDSWDLARGAIDDAAGCGIVLEGARLAAEHAKADGRAGPARTIRVVLFAAEENSGAGGKAYATAHAAEIDKHMLAIEADLGTDRVLTVRFTGAANSPFDEVARALEPLGIARKAGEAHPGSDVTPLVNAGVPTVDLRQDASRYFDLHHSVNDTEDRLDAQAMAQVSTAYAEVAYRVSELPGGLARPPVQPTPPAKITPGAAP
ncbi:MAG: M28 family peptidase [Polyangiaceae bacterium]